MINRDLTNKRVAYSNLKSVDYFHRICLHCKNDPPNDKPLKGLSYLEGEGEGDYLHSLDNHLLSSRSPLSLLPSPLTLTPSIFFHISQSHMTSLKIGMISINYCYAFYPNEDSTRNVIYSLSNNLSPPILLSYGQNSI